MESHIRDGEEPHSDIASGQPVPSGGAGGDPGQSQGVGDPQGPVERVYRWPTLEEIRNILYELAVGLTDRSGKPLPAFQIENQSYLESALGLPHQPYYRTFHNALAAMVRSIAANHPLVDGNKRLAVTVLHSTLLVNGFIYLWDDDDAVALALRCATGETDFGWLSEFIEIWAAPVDLGPVRMDAVPLMTLMEQQRSVLSPLWADRGKARHLMSAHARGRADEQQVAVLLDAVRAGEI